MIHHVSIVVIIALISLWACSVHCIIIIKNIWKEGGIMAISIFQKYFFNHSRLSTWLYFQKTFLLTLHLLHKSAKNAFYISIYGFDDINMIEQCNKKIWYNYTSSIFYINRKSFYQSTDKIRSIRIFPCFVKLPNNWTCSIKNTAKAWELYPCFKCIWFMTCIFNVYSMLSIFTTKKYNGNMPWTKPCCISHTVPFHSPTEVIILNKQAQ